MRYAFADTLLPLNLINGLPRTQNRIIKKKIVFIEEWDKIHPDHIFSFIVSGVTLPT